MCIKTIIVYFSSFLEHIHAQEKSNDNAMFWYLLYRERAFDDAKAGELISSIIPMFQDVYSAKRNDNYTNVNYKLMHDLIFYLDELYSNDPDHKQY